MQFLPKSIKPMDEKLTELFQCMCRKEAIPQDFKDALVIHLYKRKGKHAGMILAKVLLSCLNTDLDQAGLIQEIECGFRKDRGIRDMIFTTESWEQAAHNRTKWRCLSLKQRQYVKQKESAKNGKQEPRDHFQTQHRRGRRALFATDRLEQTLA